MCSKNRLIFFNLFLLLHLYFLFYFLLFFHFIWLKFYNYLMRAFVYYVEIWQPVDLFGPVDMINVNAIGWFRCTILPSIVVVALVFCLYLLNRKIWSDFNIMPMKCEIISILFEYFHRAESKSWLIFSFHFISIVQYKFRITKSKLKKKKRTSNRARRNNI